MTELSPNDFNTIRWTITISPDAAKDLKKLDKPIQIRIFKYIQQKLIECDNPKTHGTKLMGPLEPFWRYRVGDYRLIAHFIEETRCLDIKKIGHRKEVYEKELAH